MTDPRWRFLMLRFRPHPARPDGEEDGWLGDLEQVGVDYLYRQVGLRRYRRARLVHNAAGDILAAAVAHRGPIGLNFSLLENRLDLLLSPALDQPEASAVAQSLLASCADDYGDYEAAWFPVVVDTNFANIVARLGGTILRSYSQSIWLESGFVGWYRHVANIYARIAKLDARRRASNNANPE